MGETNIMQETEHKALLAALIRDDTECVIRIPNQFGSAFDQFSVGFRIGRIKVEGIRQQNLIPARNICQYRIFDSGL
ncbi:hypothetical protein D3C73_1445340 [compost metagenome]